MDEAEEHSKAAELDKGPYRLRYCFEHVYCLWSNNDKARAEFHYPVDLSDLPLSLDTIHAGERLIAVWDGPLNWGIGQSDWTAEELQHETARFNAEALAYFERLQNELGTGFVLENRFQ